MTVAGHHIPDGMVYVGGARPGDRSGSPCFIDPALEVARSNPDDAGVEMGYWPSYSQISPRCRLAYLRWLAGGKSGRGTDIGYVFLYFYGLERRMFVDGPDAREAAAIVAEVRRLRSIYGSNNSFQGYSGGFLNAAEVRAALVAGAGFEDFRPDLAAPAHSMPLALKLAIATRVAKDRPLTFELAIAGLFGLAPDALPFGEMVLEHARPQLLEMMRPRFEAACPLGFKLRARKDSRLRLLHRCATAGMEVELAASAGMGELCDPATLTWTKLIDLTAPAAAELQAFAKLVAYRPARAASLSAFAALPASLGPAAAGPTATAARDWLGQLPKPIARVGFAELARQALGESVAKWTLRHHRAVGDALAATAYGLEPHPAAGGIAIADDTPMFVFPDADAGRPRSSSYQAAAVGAEVAAAIAGVAPAARQSVQGGDRGCLRRARRASWGTGQSPGGGPELDPCRLRPGSARARPAPRRGAGDDQRMGVRPFRRAARRGRRAADSQRRASRPSPGGSRCGLSA